jgi:hypothetical protein
MAELGPPPRFGPDGSDPPLESDPVLLAGGFTFVEATSDRERAWEALYYLLFSDQAPYFAHIRSKGIRFGRRPDEFEFEDARRWASANNPFGSDSAKVYLDFFLEASTDREWQTKYGYKLYDRPDRKPDPEKDRRRRIARQYGELRRISYGAHWRRENPVSQLAPGTSFEKRIRIETGLTTSASQKLSASLGAKAPIGWVELGAKLTGCLNRSITITQQTLLETTHRLTNDSASGRDIRFALWHPIETIWVAALTMSENPDPQERETVSEILAWKLISCTSFATRSSTAVNITSDQVI